MSVLRRVKCVIGEGGSSSGLIGPVSIWVDHSRTWHYVSKGNLFWALWVCRENRNYPAFIVRPDLEPYCTACPLCKRDWESDEMPPEGGHRGRHQHYKGNGKAGKGQGRGGGHGGAQWQGQGGHWRDHRYHPYGASYAPLPTAQVVQATEQNKQNEDQLPNEAWMVAWPPQPPSFADEELNNFEEWFKQQQQDGLLQVAPEAEQAEQDWSEEDAEAWLQ